MKKPRVVIIGGGFGGLEVAKKLKDAPVDIILIDKLNHHAFHPLLYQVATGALSETDIAIPFRDIFSGQKNIEVLLGTVTKIEKEKKLVTFADGESLSYDFLVVAAGARHSYFGRKEWEKHAPGLKTIQDALLIREKIITAFEKAERCCLDEKEKQKNLTFVVVGAGPTGVEIAGALGEIALQSLAKEYKKIDTSQAKIYLIDALPRILPAFPEAVSHQAQKYLEELDVTILTNTLVKEVNNNSVELINSKIEAGTIIWAAGNEASPLVRSLQVPLDKQGKAIVRSDTSIEGFPELFVIGDSSCFLDKDNKPLPGLAPVAKQQGKYVASLIERNIPLEKRAPFSYNDPGMMVTIGRGKASTVQNDKISSGFFAWLKWSFIHLFHLMGLGNRVVVFFHWLALYFSHRRRMLLVLKPMDEIDLYRT